MRHEKNKIWRKKIAGTQAEKRVKIWALLFSENQIKTPNEWHRIDF